MKLRLLALCACVLFAPAVPANAQSKDQPVSGYMVCTIIEMISRPFPIAEGATIGDASRVMSQWRDAAQRWNGGRCFYGTRAEMEEEFATQHRKILAALGTPGVVDFKPDWTRIIPSSRRGGKASRTAPAETADSERLPPKQSTPDSAREAERARIAAREAREAEFQAKVAAHEASVAEYQRKVKAREDEIARQNAAHAAAQEKARLAKEAYAQKMTMFERVVEDQKRRHREYEAAVARNNRCRGGDQQACADIKAGKPALDEQLADAGEAKTSDDDARTCVAEPVVSESKTWKNALQAVVVNGCKAPVDVRICLLRTGGWNCSMVTGLQPQDRWAHWSYETGGEIFWDAKIADSDKQLASPPGK